MCLSIDLFYLRALIWPKLTHFEKELFFFNMRLLVQNLKHLEKIKCVIYQSLSHNHCISDSKGLQSWTTFAYRSTIQGYNMNY